MSRFPRLALLASPGEQAREAEKRLRERHDFVPLEDADAVIALGGDGFLLQLLHRLLEQRRDLPAYGMNLGTIGFLMNNWHPDDLLHRLERAKSITVTPLMATIEATSGQRFTLPAINEVSLLRETRQAAKLQIDVNDRTVLDELICDGVLVATPVGSTAYNLSANGPILPLDSSLLALTPISPFRPRRWKGAILPDRYVVKLTILESGKRPVSAVADQREIRDISSVEVALDRNRSLTLLFDPEHALDDRIAMEQFIT
ncbi:MAG: NAD kinase [Sphingomonadales bacterium]|jgi:NAD+ kinase|nr:NAD kinase [Sphingomonadales bacterium]MBK9003715.1 NAD kinase [Sphingomonadales bacterium]MBK9268889.1 NAD kinase [Sphingomonadales bacterium]MBP6434959.1 NAD kinase [Sphingorhabdus sp.]